MLPFQRGTALPCTLCNPILYQETQARQIIQDSASRNDIAKLWQRWRELLLYTADFTYVITPCTIPNAAAVVVACSGHNISAHDTCIALAAQSKRHEFLLSRLIMPSENFPPTAQVGRVVALYTLINIPYKQSGTDIHASVWFSSIIRLVLRQV